MILHCAIIDHFKDLSGIHVETEQFQLTLIKVITKKTPKENSFQNWCLQ